MHAPLDWNADPAAYLERLGAPYAMYVGKPDRGSFLVGYIHASDARHLRFSSKEQK
jgi:hypothetical protein